MPDQLNILVIWGDDIGITNLSCYSDGLMGYRIKASLERASASGWNVVSVKDDWATVFAD